jgi:hypothetical protein
MRAINHETGSTWPIRPPTRTSIALSSYPVKFTIGAENIGWIVILFGAD